MITIRRYFSVIAGLVLVSLALSRVAHATGEPCTVDTDCKTDPSCGGEICDWTKMQTCQPATAEPEGWCTLDTHCKCQAEGATCDKSMFQCTKTLATSAGGSSGSAGTSGAAAGSTSASAGSSSTSSTDSSSSSCAFAAGVPRGSLGFAFGAACATAWLGARRRRRAA
ncbi:MAG TPA: hypothetical protein VHV51_11660 [Polyangiaceae bacterium]|jgi:hypothetical protein|nr:hypothetical protein [Polyangiaceae bacterium]